MQDREQSKLLHIALELEKKYPLFKKMDIHTTVNEAYKKERHLVKKITDHEFDEVKKLADQDLSLS
jgi:hypothetical protein